MTELLKQQVAVRDDLVEFMRADLMGPREPDEVLVEAPLTRYISGILYPTLPDGSTIPAEAESQSDVADDDGDLSADPAVAMSNIQYPSSAGITVAVDPAVDEILAQVSAATYEPSEEGWLRRQLGPFEPKIPLAVEEDRIELTNGLELYYRARGELAGARSVTVVLVNKQTGEPGA
jgi:hypothetical protein